MKLLFDQNLSPRLVTRLADLYPGSIHVESLGLGTALDDAIWNYARQNDCFIVTKDADFSEMGLLAGFPPKIIWIRRGNCSTKEIETILREAHASIQAMSKDFEIGVLMLF
jgi:predicted nuclease of predicted toxin-antitoxin system